MPLSGVAANAISLGAVSSASVTEAFSRVALISFEIRPRPSRKKPVPTSILSAILSVADIPPNSRELAIASLPAVLKKASKLLFDLMVKLET